MLASRIVRGTRPLGRLAPSGHISSPLSGLKFPSGGLFALRSPVGSVRYNSSVPSEISATLPEMASMAPEAAAKTGVVCDHIGALSDAGLVTSYLWPSDILARLLEAVHVYSGLPWWGTITVVAIGVRLAMVPLYLKSSDATARMSAAKPELDAITEEMKEQRENPNATTVMLQKRGQIMKKYGVKTRYMLAPVLQIPLALGMFNGLRKMANYPVDGFSTGGLSWFTDLSQQDPYCALPILTAATFVAFIRLGGETGAQNMTLGMRNFFTVLPILSIAFTYSLSSAVVWYFAVNSVFLICQTMFLRSKFVRKTFGLAEIVPPPPQDLSKKKGFLETINDMKRESQLKAKAREAQLKNEAYYNEAQKRSGKAVRKSVFKKEYVK